MSPFLLDGQLASTTVFAVGVTSTAYRQTSYGHDDFGRLTSIVDSVAGTTTFAFDKRGLRRSLTDAADNETAWTYDAFGRAVTETDAFDNERTFTYDGAGNLIRAVDRNGRVIDYRYDETNRRTHEYWYANAGAAPSLPTDVNGWGSSYTATNALRTFTYTYDEAGRLENAADSGATGGAPANSYAYQYVDGLDRVAQSMFALAGSPTFTLDYEYFKSGLRQELKAQLGTTDDFVNTYQYDEVGRVESIKQTGQVGGAAVNDKRVDFTYDDLGRVETIVRSSDLAGTTEVATTTYGFDPLDRLTSLVHKHGTTTLDAYGWTYDEFDRLETFSSTTTGTTTYTYDASNQLTGADRTGTADDEAYTYDDNGNRTDDGFVTDDGDANRLGEDATFTYGYDAEGNRTTRTRKSTDPADDHLTEYRWDHRNRLVGITFKDENNDVTKRIEYTYDVFDRRIGRTVLDENDAVLDAETRLYDGDRVVMDLDGDGDVVRRYLLGTDGFTVLAQETVGTTNETLWLLADDLGSTRAMVDDSGAVTSRYAFDGFGKLLSSSDPLETRILYTGLEWDADAGLWHALHRDYESSTTRWLNPDPIGFRAGDTNLMRYVRNSPMSKVDPSGLAEIHPLMTERIAQERSRWAARFKRMSPSEHRDWGWKFEQEYRRYLLNKFTRGAAFANFLTAGNECFTPQRPGSPGSDFLRYLDKHPGYKALREHGGNTLVRRYLQEKRWEQDQKEIIAIGVVVGVGSWGAMTGAAAWSARGGYLIYTHSDMPYGPHCDPIDGQLLEPPDSVDYLDWMNEPPGQAPGAGGGPDFDLEPSADPFGEDVTREFETDFLLKPLSDDPNMTPGSQFLPELTPPSGPLPPGPWRSF